MSVILVNDPFVLWEDPYDFYEEELFEPATSWLSQFAYPESARKRRPRPQRRRRQRQSTAVAPAADVDKDKFKVSLDVQHFKPEEICVKVTGGNTVTIEANHEEKPDEHGFISRQFVRKYVIPPGHDINQVQSKLSTDGVLTITAPKIAEPGKGERVIPITRVHQSPVAVEQQQGSKMDQN